MQTLARLCIRRPVFATMLILALVVVGLDSYRKLGVDYFPKVEFPYVNVRTTLRGASPEEVESQITKPLEEAVNTISGIDELNSSSFEGVSILTIAFVLEKDPDVGAQEIRDKINSVLSQLPRDVDQPIVEKLNTDASPVINIVVSANRDMRETTKLVDDLLKKNLESLNGVGEVRFVGDRKRQVQVALEPDKLYSYNLNVEQVRGALAAQNIEVPGGRLDQGAREVSVRTMGRIEKPSDFGRVIVGNVRGAPIRVSDIGTVTDGFEEPRSFARLNGSPAVVLQIRKQAGTNTLDVIAAVKERVASLKSQLPPDIQISYARDQSGFIQAAFEAVQEHLIMGGFLAAMIVLLFIRNWRSTLIAAIAIPTSIISTFTLMNIMGFTLNQITMLALTLIVGIVIDDAIVVLEIIFKTAEEKKVSPVEAAIEGTREIGLAVLSTTLSLIIIFIPIAMMPGIVGKFMSSFGYVAAFAIGVSLLVSFTLTPMLCSRFLQVKTEDEGGTKDTIVFRMFAVPYRAMLAWSMDHRWVIVVFSIAVMASSVPMISNIGIDFLPVEDQSEFEITLRMPIGSSLDGTTKVIEQMEQDLKQLPGVRDMLATVGADIRQQVDRGSILMELVPVKDRKYSQRQLMDMAREKLSKYRDVQVGVQLPSLIQGGAGDRDLMYSLQGPDLAELDRAAKALIAKLRTVNGLFDLESSYESGKPEVRVNINRDKASDLNVNVASIANAVRVLVGGDNQVTTYKEGDDRYDVLLQVKPEFRRTARTLDQLFVPSTRLGNVALSNVALFQEGEGPVSIDRYNRQRRIMVSGNLSKGLALGDVLTTVDQTIKDLNLPPNMHYGAVGRSRELGRAARNFFFAFLLSVVFMYMILAANYESFIDPVTILLSLPLAVPFALLSLILARENFSIIYTSLGILVLFGIVKKNSILQIDHIKQLRRAGMSRMHAIKKGCEDRLRPILMTTAALIAGMIPLAVGSGAGAGTRRTVAVVVIGGQSMALLLTLVVTPVAYSLFDDLAHFGLFSRIRGWMPRRSTALMLLVLLMVGLTQAQTPPQASRVGVSQTERRITLEDSLRMALKNNLEIELERSNRATAEAIERAAKGAFDGVLRVSPNFSRMVTPVSSTLAAADGRLTEKVFNPQVSWQQRTKWNGLSYNLTSDNSYNTTTNPFTSLSPFYSSRLTAGLTVPLLRGRQTDPMRVEVVLRRKQRDMADSDFELKVIDVITRVQSAYWDLVASLQDVNVKAGGIALSEEQLARDKRMIAQGTMAPVELAASEAELQRRKDDYLASLANLTMLENNLKMLLAPARDDAMWGERLMPADAQQVEPKETELAPAIGAALKSRPELKSLVLRKDVNDVQKSLAQDQTKPLVNLTANYINAGLAGTALTTSSPFTAAFAGLGDRINALSALAGLPTLPGINIGGSGPPASFVGGYGQTLHNMFSLNYPGISAGVQVEWNPRNRAALAAVDQALINERRLKLQRQQVEQVIEAQVRNALQSLTSAKQRVEAALAAERASQEKLDSEVRLFQTGESTNFFVLTRQNELLNSRLRSVAASLELNKAAARLEQAVGSTLAAHGITLQ